MAVLTAGSNVVSTLVVGVILLVIVVLVIRSMHKKKKNGGSACGCGCADCSMNCAGHTKEFGEKK